MQYVPLVAVACIAAACGPAATPQASPRPLPESQQADKPDAGLTKADVAFNRCHDQSHYGDATTCWRAFLQS